MGVAVDKFNIKVGDLQHSGDFLLHGEGEREVMPARVSSQRGR